MAAVWLLARVDAQVPGEVAFAGECHGADVAAIGLLARVDAQVPGEGPFAGECHGALWQP